LAKPPGAVLQKGWFMHYYQFNIGDWALHTSHLTLEEEGVYRRILDFYYDTELPIPKDTKPVIRRLRLSQYSDIVDIILEEYFYLEDDGWHNKRVDEEITKFQSKSDRAKVNGAKGGRPPKGKEEEPKAIPKEPRDNPEITQKVNFANPEESKSKANEELLTTNEELLTINDKPKDQKTMPSKLDDELAVIEYLNLISSSNYQPVESNRKLIRARLAEGRTVDEIKSVIDRQNMEWPPDSPHRKYLRPATLFNSEKFNQYFGQLGQPITTGNNNGQSQRSDKHLGAVGRISATIDARAKERARIADLQGGRGDLHQGGITLEEV
jgi:uncharacterized phage protein (TIGR02220 family)